MSLILRGWIDPRLRKSCRGSGSHEKVKIDDLFERARIRVSPRNPDSDPHDKLKINETDQSVGIGKMVKTKLYPSLF